MFLNNSKFFAGVVMILLNIGSKFISIQFSKSTEEYLKMNVTKQLLVFAMAWMGTRDIYTSLVLTAVFTILSDHLFNEDSSFCIVPHEYRIMKDVLDTNKDGIVSKKELDDANSFIHQFENKAEFQKLVSDSGGKNLDITIRNLKDTAERLKKSLNSSLSLPENSLIIAILN
jgi:hypothetical protein